MENMTIVTANLFSIRRNILRKEHQPLKMYNFSSVICQLWQRLLGIFFEKIVFQNIPPDT